MPEQTTAIDKSLCPLCGQINQCAMEIEKSTGIKQAACWCVGMDFSADLIASVPKEAQGQACICAACAAGQGSDLLALALSG
jgi:Cysteine-rich CWC